MKRTMGTHNGPEDPAETERWEAEKRADKRMDEFMPGNADRERRGRVAYERWRALGGNQTVPWNDMALYVQDMWQQVAEAAFEEGRAFERERWHSLEGMSDSNMAQMLRDRGYRVYDPGTWVVADDGMTVPVARPIDPRSYRQGDEVGHATNPLHPPTCTGCRRDDGPSLVDFR